MKCLLSSVVNITVNISITSAAVEHLHGGVDCATLNYGRWQLTNRSHSLIVVNGIAT